MIIGTSFFVLVAVIAIIWVFIEVKRLKHKLFAFFLIGLIILTYISFSVSLSQQDIDYKSPSGILNAGKLYFSWMGSMFTKFKSVTAYALKLDWKEYNETITKKDPEKEKIWDLL